MHQRTLAAALNAALKSRQAPSNVEHTGRNASLIEALRNSTTRKDQIVQRRIGSEHHGSERDSTELCGKKVSSPRVV